MSLDVMSAVWKHSEHKGNALLTLLSIADNADDDGFAFPSYDHIAAKTRLSKRTAQNMVSQLLESDELSLVARGTQGRSNEYSVNVAHLRAKPVQVAKSATSSDGNPGGNPGGKQVATPTVSIPTASLQPSDSTTTGVAETATDDGHLPGLEPPPSSPAVDDDVAAVAEVWQHHLATFEDRIRVKELTPPRARDIRKALKAVDGDVALCKRATDGLKSYRDSHPDGSQDVSLSVIFTTSMHDHRNLTEKIEWWASQAEPSSGPSIDPSVPSVLRDRITRRRVEVAQMLHTPEPSEAVRERGERALAWLRAEAKEEPELQDGRFTGRFVRVS